MFIVKCSVAFLSLLILVSESKAKNFWNQIQSVSFLDIVQVGTTRLAINSLGQVLRSHTDYIWEQIELPVGERFVSMTNCQGKIFVVSPTGGILCSSDTGQSWSKVDLKSSSNFQFIESKGKSIVIGGERGRLSYSANEGKNWLNFKYDTPIAFFSASFVTDQKCVVVGDSGICLQTENGGVTWERILVGTRERLTSISFNSHGNGVVIGEKFAAVQIKGRWKVVRNLPVGKFNSVLYHNDTILIGKDSGLILYSIDNGRSWSRMDPNINISRFSSVNRMRYQDSVLLIAGFPSLIGVATSLSERFTIISYFPISVDTNYYNVGSALCVPNRDYIVCGVRNEIFQTFDGGNSWRIIGKLQDYEQSTSIQMFDDSHGLVSSDMGNVYQIENGKCLLIFKVKALPTKIIVSTNFDGLLVNGSKIYRTIDRGYSWFECSSIIDTQMFITDVFNAKGVYYILGRSDDAVFKKSTNSLLKSHDLLNWEKTELSGRGINSMFFWDQQKGIVCGDSGLIMSTIDGGHHWKASTIGNVNLEDIKFYNDSLGFVIGEKNAVLVTYDAGKTWRAEYLWSSYNQVRFRNLYVIEFQNDSSVWIYGNNDIYTKNVYNYVSIAAKFTQTPVLNHSVKISVFPNPSNDITYTHVYLNVTTNELVEPEPIYIYDILGRIVAKVDPTSIFQNEIRYEFSVKNILAGTYTVAFLNNNLCASTKLVVLRNS